MWELSLSSPKGVEHVSFTRWEIRSSQEVVKNGNFCVNSCLFAILINLLRKLGPKPLTNVRYNFCTKLFFFFLFLCSANLDKISIPFCQFVPGMLWRYKQIWFSILFRFEFTQNYCLWVFPDFIIFSLFSSGISFSYLQICNLNQI